MSRPSIILTNNRFFHYEWTLLDKNGTLLSSCEAYCFTKENLYAAIHKKRMECKAFLEAEIIEGEGMEGK